MIYIYTILHLYYILWKLASGLEDEDKTYGYEEIRDAPFVLLPALSVLQFASLNVPICSMNDHDTEEDCMSDQHLEETNVILQIMAPKPTRIKPWKGAVETCNQTPCQGEIQIRSIVDLASISI